ncbi:zinc finger MYM-type protein 1-like [Manduca sexta]|uniref:zinc finger MYM-type protein 1-like n=1 Tax=Manduca sexta TaxID=7130 RepID=UPI00189035C6|nr:zinc finger MYM-type protein 1-like [Manduca sexta]
MKTLYQLNLISNKKDEREECKNIINILGSYDFLVLVTFFSSLFEIINPISKALQHENNDLQKSSILLSNLLNRLCQLRNQISFNESKDLPKEWGVTTVFKNSMRKITKRFFYEFSQDERISDPESYFKVNVYYCCLDILISQTKEKFQSLCDLSSMFEILQPEKLLSSSNEEILIASGKLSVKYSKDISVNLCDQLKALKTCLKSEIQKIYSMKELIELLLVKFNSLASSFPEVITACFLFLTLPVTTATAERSFSKLKLIKNYLRTSMGQERLSDLSLLSIEVETLEKLKSSSAINDLINQFAEK